MVEDQTSKPADSLRMRVNLSRNETIHRSEEHVHTLAQQGDEEAWRGEHPDMRKANAKESRGDVEDELRRQTD